MKLDALIRNWWMIGVRGMLAIGFALAILLWPGVDLGTIVVLFAVYAIADGVWSIAAAVRVSARMLDAWPVALEGCLSVVVGAVVLFWPFVPYQFVAALAIWGIVTGVLEVLTAMALPRHGTRHWFLATGGVSSVFLAVLLLALPHADADTVVRLLIAYAVVFGVATLVSATRFSGTQPAGSLRVGRRPAR